MRKEQFFDFSAEGDELFFGDVEFFLAFANFRGFEGLEVGFGVDLGFVLLCFFLFDFLDVDESAEGLHKCREKIMKKGKGYINIFLIIVLILILTFRHIEIFRKCQ